MDSYKDAVNKLNYFISNDILDYASKRNYDFGPEVRNNVSMLSKFISHSVLNEYDIINLSLSKYPLTKIDKYIQEVFWRIYWKGWLEHRPNVWSDYCNFVEDESNKNLIKAQNGETGIDCFDNWINELKEYNYLHNHTRMWFASIWIFTLKLPWQAGANFFMRHLFDGDAASNTLSWRWVAGLQTVGKNYLATASNIYKFTNKKFKPTNLNEEAEPVIDSKIYHINDVNFTLSDKQNELLVVCDTKLDYKNYKDFCERYEQVLLLELDNDYRKIKLSSNVLKFKSLLINDFSENIPNSKVVSGKKLKEIIGQCGSYDIIYPNIGEHLTFLQSLKIDTKACFIHNANDIFCWNYSKKGFFNFKKNIPSIINKIADKKDLFS